MFDHLDQFLRHAVPAPGLGSAAELLQLLVGAGSDRLNQDARAWQIRNQTVTGKAPSSPLLHTIAWRLPRDWPPSCLVARQTAVHRPVQSSRLGVSRNAASSAAELAVNNGGSGSRGGGRAEPG